MMFGGRYSHAVRKVPKAGDFGEQDDHGGIVRDHEPTAEQNALVRRAAACHPVPVYGRVDLVRDNAGRVTEMELERIAPDLWLRCHPPAGEAFAAGVAVFLAENA